MKLHELKTTPGSRTRRTRVGRGDGSGLGGTAGRGEKGQRSRTGAAIRHHFEGGQTPTFRRIPKRGFTVGVKVIYNVANIQDINEIFDAGTVIDENVLRAKGLIGKKEAPLKILGNGEITKAFTFKANKFSDAAKAKIEAAGGTVEVISAKKAVAE